jgi:hypothetical protein
MSTAKKTLFATIGAGEKAIERTRAISSRIGELPTQLRRTGSLRGLPKAAASLRTQGTKRVTSFLHTGRVRTEQLVASSRKQAVREFDDLATRGEKLVRTIRRSQKTKTAVEKTKTAARRTKSATKAASEAASATAAAVESAAQRVESHTDPNEATA